MSRPCASWISLPNEMKLAILDVLDLNDAKAFAKIDRSAYSIAVPVLFRTVNLPSLDALLKFLNSVPESYFHHIRLLSVSTLTVTVPVVSHSFHPATDALVSLLTASSNLQHLDLHLANSLAHSIIPVFSSLTNLKHLSIINQGDDVNTPISERLVVAIAAAVPALEHLHLDRISRSHIHASDLVGSYPSVPVVVSGDETIPDHPVLGSSLSLPSLLRLPSLRSLTIHDTHLGDPLWCTTTPLCHLTSLDLGYCSHAPPTANSLFSHYILSAVASSLQSLTLTASLDSIPLSPLPSLQHLRLAPFFSPDGISTTVAALSAAPINCVSVHAFADDFVDVCTAISGVLALRLDRGPSSPFLPSLTHIDVALVPIPFIDDPPPRAVAVATTTTDEIPPFIPCTKFDDAHELAAAAHTLRDFCRDLYFTSSFLDLTGTTPSCLVTVSSGGCLDDDDNQDGGDIHPCDSAICQRPDDRSRDRSAMGCS